MDIAALLQDRTRLTLAAQPIVDLRRGEVVGYEGLSRFQLDPPAGPDRVFAEAARQGLGAELESVVVARCLELAQQKPTNCFFAMNVDPSHLLEPAVRKVLEATPDLRGIVLELTEHRAIENMKALAAELGRLRERGALVAVDDAGSGYSGLQQILALRPQILKVDRALVMNVHEDDAKRALIQMLGELAGRLDAWLLAEGVETESELSLLRQIGVPLAQGYFLARPAPPWADILPVAQRVLVNAAPSLRPARILRPLLEPCATCLSDEDWPAQNTAVRLSGEGRPLGLRFLNAEQHHVRSEHELMRVKPDSALESVAQRAATRPERVRWDPLICTDDRGLFLGIVRMSRLVCALASQD
ncbi:MAG TPA: EAL domain-containing protein [Polyangiaceae bacterium]|nr:EAL domain-containing protein [Polyangiaceae bacterium]